MAETKKKTTTANKTASKKKVDKDNNIKEKAQEVIVSPLKTDAELENERLKIQIEEMAKQLQQLMTSMEKPTTNTVVVENNTQNTKNIKVTSMLNYVYSLSTQPYGKGRVYTFNKYLDTKLIKLNDLLDIINIYSEQFEKGYALLHSKEDYTLVGLDYVFESVFTKEKMANIVELKSEQDLEFILALEDDSIYESILSVIAEKVVKGYNYDMRLLSRLKTETELEEYIKAKQEEQ